MPHRAESALGKLKHAKIQSKPCHRVSYIEVGGIRGVKRNVCVSVCVCSTDLDIQTGCGCPG